MTRLCRRRHARRRRPRAHPPAAAQAPEKVVFALNWFAVGDHAAYWVALEKGYYKARGLDVELQNSKGSGDSIAKVDTGRADIGLADSAVVIAAVGRGGKVKVVGHGVRQDAAQHLEPEGGADHPAQGPRGQDDRRAARRRPAPGLPRLRQAPRHRPERR